MADTTETKKKERRPNIATYHDYREFLRDIIGYLSTSQAGFSLRSLARASKLSPSYLSMVLSGHRSLSAVALEQLGPHLAFSETEAKYCELLRAIVEESTPERREAALNKLQKLKAYRDHFPREFVTFRYLSNWYCVAIREMSSMPDFQEDPTWIQSRLREKIPLPEITKALEFLKENGLLQARNDPTNLDCVGGVYRLALRQLHREMLQQTAEAIESVASDERHILGHVLSIPQARLPELKAILDETLKRIEKLSSDAKNADSVYHVSLTAVPLTENPEGEKS